MDTMNLFVYKMSLIACLLLIFCGGCIEVQSPTGNVKVWSQRGLGDGRFHKPRAVAVDAEDNLFIVDMTGRIQVFDAEQNFIRNWRTPEVKMGKPCGMTVGNDGVLMVADTHYHRVIFYDIEGNLLDERTIGGTQGLGPVSYTHLTLPTIYSV